jgi:hypothetical protein
MSVRRSAFVVAVASVAVLMLAAQAFAVVQLRHDTDDFEIAPDVHSTAKRVFLAPDGDGWWLRISAAGDVGPRYRIKVLLDTSGGPGAEFAMVAIVRGLELVSCSVRHLDGPRIESNCDADPYRAWWGVSRRDLDRDKTIRWRILAFGGADLDRLTDIAPDSGGWYS